MSPKVPPTEPYLDPDGPSTTDEQVARALSRFELDTNQPLVDQLRDIQAHVDRCQSLYSGCQSDERSARAATVVAYNTLVDAKSLRDDLLSQLLAPKGA